MSSIACAPVPLFLRQQGGRNRSTSAQTALCNNVDQSTPYVFFNQQLVQWPDALADKTRCKLVSGVPCVATEVCVSNAALQRGESVDRTQKLRVALG